MTIGHIIFCAKNEYNDGQFLAGGCGSRQRQVADGADVVFTDTPIFRPTAHCHAVPSRNQNISIYLICHMIILFCLIFFFVVLSIRQKLKLFHVM